MVGPGAGPAECCPAASRVRGRQEAGVPLGTSQRDLKGRKGHRQIAREPGESLGARITSVQTSGWLRDFEPM